MRPTIKNTKKTTISTATIVGPIGVLKAKDSTIPVAVQLTETIAELIVTDLNDLKIRILLNAGKMMRADINNEPTKFIAITMIMAVTTAINKLYRLALTPVALAKFSSNVTAKILL